MLSDGSWEWPAKDLRLSPADNATADRALLDRRLAEGRDADGNYGDRGLTPAMREIEADLEHGHLEGCPEFALKEPDRFKEKLALEMLDKPTRSADELAEMIPDGIRYTFAFDNDNYAAGVRDAVGELKHEGYELLLFKNRWGEAEYKGINSRWRDPDSDQLFEVQFHTHEGWAVKQSTHDAYDRAGSSTISPNERQDLRRYMVERSATISIPPDVFEIPEYRRDAR